MRKFLLGIAFVLVSAAAAQADDGWTAWGDNFTKVMTDCVKAAQPNCLSKAFTDKERPAVGTYTADLLYRDLAAAEVMLHQTDASNAMYDQYGIDSPAYLGTGYSVPVVGEGANNYEYGRQREYFAPNLCADAQDPTVCPKKDPGVWTWQLDSKTLTKWLDKPLAKFIRAHWPKTEAKLFAARYAPTAKSAKPNVPPLILRFANLPNGVYTGKVGKPAAIRVFFADFEQVRVKTLRNAVIATGAQSLLQNPSPTSTFFIWIYAPDANSQAALASWKELFTLLSQPAP